CYQKLTVFLTSVLNSTSYISYLKCISLKFKISLRSYWGLNYALYPLSCTLAQADAGASRSLNDIPWVN
ncbi:MAG: hypothetical protein ACI837_001334, partial [Crocinitomicaceae bacterium]